MKNLILIFTIIGTIKLTAQSVSTPGMGVTANPHHELTVGVGFANYIGDLSIGLADFKAFHLSYSGAYRYNFKNYFSMGLNFYHQNVSGYDSDNAPNNDYSTNEAYVYNRNLSFHSSISQGSLDVRFEPFRTVKSWENGKMLLSPYVNVGLGFFKFNPKTMYNGKDVELQPLGTEGQGLAGYAAKYSLFDMCIPANIGLKIIPPSRVWSLAFDIGYNLTFTDYLDDVSNVYPNKADFTNPSNGLDPATAAMAIALSDRSTYPSSMSYVSGPGQTRGFTNKDAWYTGQVKFSINFLNQEKDAYYKCCGF